MGQEPYQYELIAPPTDHYAVLNSRNDGRSWFQPSPFGTRLWWWWWWWWWWW